MDQEHDIEQLVEGVTATSKAVTSKRTPLLDWVTGEFFGTFILVFFGCGSVAAAVLLGAQSGRLPGRNHLGPRASPPPFTSRAPSAAPI
jgi:hypothetical protein